MADNKKLMITKEENVQLSNPKYSESVTLLKCKHSIYNTTALMFLLHCNLVAILYTNSR